MCDKKVFSFKEVGADRIIPGAFKLIVPNKVKAVKQHSFNEVQILELK